MKTKLFGLFFLFLASGTILLTCAQTEKKDADIKLIIRGDDIGSFHAANLACLKSYTDGIMRSVEVMVPCPWYPEAVEMLNENPGLDVGIHLVMTSEWKNMKWRPLTGISSITDARGYFFPMVWPNENFGPEQAFRNSEWTLKDVEKELRAQIECALKDIRGISHLSSHMGFGSADPSIDSLIAALAAEYRLNFELSGADVQWFSFDRSKEASLDANIDSFKAALRALQPGKYFFIEHPGLDTPELESVGHVGYTNVGADRQMVTDLFTSKEIMKEINRLGIKLVSYADVK